MAFCLLRSPGMELHPSSYYAHALKPRLPAAVFRPAGSRLAWLPVHLAVVVMATMAIARHWVPWPLVPLLSLAIGMSFAGLTFLGHELLHGAIVRGSWGRLIPILAWVCFAPFALSQQLWVVWHNRVHHSTTNRLGVDPDMYPSLDAYRSRRATRWTIDNFALGGGRLRGLLSLLLGFMAQSKDMLVIGRTRLGMSAREHRQAILETVLAVALWLAVGLLVGPVPFLFAYVLPILVADVVVMGFILTNHCLSPATDINDPLVNALSVTAPRWFEWLTLHFGFHVEHHVFPSMSLRHARRVRAELLEGWPERYETMTVLTALRALYGTGRVYKDATTLVDPRTGGQWPTLLPRGA